MLLISPKINNVQYIIKNVNDCIQGYLYNGNQWSSDILDIIKTYIAKNKLTHFLCVGSHIGSISLPISYCINNVTAIEAYPETYDHLCENIKYNNILNINTFNIAVGNSSETIYFMDKNAICPREKVNRTINNSGGMHVFTEHDIQNNIRSANLSNKKIKNEMNKLDNLPINYFDILLVDIEGCEYDFLLGATEKIKKYKPIIIIEIWNNSKRHEENMNTTQQQVIDYIISLNYKLISNTLYDDFIFESN